MLGRGDPYAMPQAALFLRVALATLTAGFLAGCSPQPRLVTSGTPPPDTAHSVTIFLYDNDDPVLGEIAAQALLRAGYELYLADDLRRLYPRQVLTEIGPDASVTVRSTDVRAEEAFGSTETDLVAVVRGRAWTGHVSNLSLDLVDASTGRLHFTAAVRDEGRVDIEIAAQLLYVALADGHTSEQPLLRTGGASRVRW